MQACECALASLRYYDLNEPLGRPARVGFHDQYKFVQTPNYDFANPGVPHVLPAACMDQLAAPEIIRTDLCWTQRAAVCPQQVDPVRSRRCDCVGYPRGTTARLIMRERFASVQGEPAVNIAIADAVDGGATRQRNKGIMRGEPYELCNNRTVHPL